MFLTLSPIIIGLFEDIIQYKSNSRLPLLEFSDYYCINNCNNFFENNLFFCFITLLIHFIKEIHGAYFFLFSNMQLDAKLARLFFNEK